MKRRKDVNPKFHLDWEVLMEGLADPLDTQPMMR